MNLKIKPIAINTYRENVLILSRDCHALRPERLKGSRKVEITAAGVRLLASVVISEDPLLVGPDEVGISQPAFRRLGAPAGAFADVVPAPPPSATSAIFDKIRGGTLTSAQLTDVVHDLVDHRWSDMEIAAFLVACASFMSAEETLALTDAMARAGKRLDWDHRLVVDKHCIGGIPGNRTSLIVAPIVAAHGLLFPKTSSRAITSPFGTADTMEVLARVDLDEQEMRAVVERCGGCVVWGGRVDLSPADDVLISVERPLAIDTPDQMVASILSKKIAAGSTSLIIDVPVGPSAKVRDSQAALRLRKLFEFVGSRLGLHIEIVLTDGSQPIGRGIGPGLEMRDVLAALRGAEDAPAELVEKSLSLAGRLLELDPNVRGGMGETRAREILASGQAMRKMEQIAEAQGPSPVAGAPPASVREVNAKSDGWVASIDCQQVARIARLAGAPTDTNAGIDLLKRKGEHIRAGEPLYRIHGVEAADLEYASAAAESDCGYSIK